MEKIAVEITKQPAKFISSQPEAIRVRLEKCIEDVSMMQGNIVKLSGKPGFYRYKIHHYRIVFQLIKAPCAKIIIHLINTRTNIKY